MFMCGLQVLPECEHLAINRSQILHHIQNLLPLFSQTKHHSCFRNHSAQPCMIQNIKGSLVFSLGTNGFVEPGNGFDVMIQNIGSGINHEIDGIKHAPEVWNEDLHSDTLIYLSDLPDGLRKNGSAAIGKLITIDGGNDRMADSHRLDSIGNASGLSTVELSRPARLHRAKAA
jgi:hypothetical protein